MGGVLLARLWDCQQQLDCASSDESKRMSPRLTYVFPFPLLLSLSLSASAVIPAGVFMTSCVLASGLLSLQQKNRVNQQYAMRSRVIAQGITVGAMMTSLMVQERQKALGIIPRLVRRAEHLHSSVYCFLFRLACPPVQCVWVKRYE